MGDPVDGIVGYGSGVEVSIAGGAYADFDGLYEFTPPPVTITNPENPQMNLANNAMARIAGKVKNYGQSTFGLVWIPGSAADTLMNSLRDAGAAVSVRITYPNGASDVYSGLFASKTPNTPWDDRMTCALVMDTTGIVTSNAAAVPANEVLPAISGTLETGDVLTAFPGVWSGGPSYTYQWKNATVAISGATSQTYTLVAGDAGDSITVTVTATNSEGSASATSAPVVAAA